MALLNGHAGRLPEVFPDRHSPHNLMEVYSVPLTIRFMRKNVDPNEMAPCVCCMLLELAIAAHANCVRSVWKVFLPATRDESAPCIGLSLRPKRDRSLPCSDRLNRCPCHLLSWDLSPSFGTIGPAVTFGGIGCKWYAPKR